MKTALLIAFAIVLFLIGSSVTHASSYGYGQKTYSKKSYTYSKAKPRYGSIDLGSKNTYPRYGSIDLNDGYPGHARYGSIDLAKKHYDYDYSYNHDYGDCDDTYRKKYKKKW